LQVRRRELREGFTTGSAAAAAAKAAATLLLSGRRLDTVDIPLPEGGRLVVPVAAAEWEGRGAAATVVKDAGDDPDVTHRARIRCRVALAVGGPPGGVSLRGGPGVGRVTRPGLPVNVGEPAINPVPRRQITQAMHEVDGFGPADGLVVEIEVPDGERIARRTLNPRLGILGGISILGTRGTVRPFSNEAYRETIRLSLDIARAGGIRSIAFSTGGRSESFLAALRPGIPSEGRIQIADFFAFSLKEARKRGFEAVWMACFFGKLLKIAQGHGYTHAHKAALDFGRLADGCSAEGLDQERARRVMAANTAREALGIIQEAPCSGRILERVTQTALQMGRRHLGPEAALGFCLFDSGGRLLICAEEGRNQAARDGAGPWSGNG